jgi:hypothetical protein
MEEFDSNDSVTKYLRYSKIDLFAIKFQFLTIFFFGILLMVLSMFLMWGFFRKQDMINMDGHSIMEDAYDFNETCNQTHTLFRNRTFRSNLATSFTLMENVTQTKRGNYFPPLIQVIINAPQRGRNYTFYYFRNSVPFNASKTCVEISVGRTSSELTDFCVPVSRIGPELSTEYLTEVQIRYAEYQSYYWFMIGKLVYVRQATYPSGIIVDIHDANELLQMKYPRLDIYNIVFASVPLMIVGFAFAIFSVWHFFSVRFQMIEESMRQADEFKYF